MPFLGWSRLSAHSGAHWMASTAFPNAYVLYCASKRAASLRAASRILSIVIIAFASSEGWTSRPPVYSISASMLGVRYRIEVLAQETSQLGRCFRTCPPRRFCLSAVDVVAKVRAKLLEALFARESVRYQTREHIGRRRLLTVSRPHEKGNRESAPAEPKCDLVGVSTRSPVFRHFDTPIDGCRMDPQFFANPSQAFRCHAGWTELAGLYSKRCPTCATTAP